MSALDRAYLRAKAVLIGFILDADRVRRTDEHAVEMAFLDFLNAEAERR